MARRKSTTPTIAPTFVGTFYDTKAGVYIATRADGTITTGRIGKRGVNVRFGVVATGTEVLTDTEN